MSNFFKYFRQRFNEFRLKKLITIFYSGDRSSSKLEVLRNENGELEEVWTKLSGNGDFRSPESVKTLQESDIVVTNPPFSLFREYIAQLVQYNKKFIVMGGIIAVTYKEVFPLIMSGQVRLGVSIHSGDREFEVSNRYRNYVKNYRIDEVGRIFTKIQGIRWLTNLDHGKYHEEIVGRKSYAQKEYFKYDNYDAINVDKVNDIPYDYYGVMGVPITFLDKYNPKQFKIISLRKGGDGKDLSYMKNGKQIFPFNRILIKPRIQFKT